MSAPGPLATCRPPESPAAVFSGVVSESHSSRKTTGGMGKYHEGMQASALAAAELANCRGEGKWEKWENGGGGGGGNGGTWREMGGMGDLGELWEIAKNTLWGV